MRLREAYNSLKLVHAWKIHKPSRRKVYEINKEFIESEVEYLKGENNLEVPCVTTKLDYAARKLVDLDESVNEKLLLHGTKPEHALSIIHNGLNEKLSGGIFGKGIYLSEDPSKIDQYCTPDVKLGEGSDFVLKLHQELYDQDAIHEGNLLYCFVSKAILGVPICTTDGLTNMREPFQDIFMSSDKRELALIPKANPPIHYHALIAEAGKGHKVLRHREFVAFEGDRLLLEYLLAFKRC